MISKKSPDEFYNHTVGYHFIILQVLVCTWHFDCRLDTTGYTEGI